ncbi:MAG TPA: M36 family metallopeptidase, partial [Pyrinomonadaceae bacterium]|nr:M36 family metallopeptidase [Pyrinomonadaceae bacterium]
TDVVAHEAGHALLDTIRPDLWTSTLTEPNAFHEAFGDCMAILTALFDQETRVALLAESPNLGTANFVEAAAEDLSDAVRRAISANHPAAAPRHALNDFKWQLPTTLPTNGPPDVLISEIHSFGRVFSGCFYDVIRNIFNSYAVKDEATLLTAAQTAGKILIKGASTAPQTPRFFQAVGRAMSAADQSLNSGANREAVRAAFARHNIALGTNAMLAPRAALAGSAPKMSAAKGAVLSATTRTDLRQRIGADPKSRLTVSALSIGGEQFAEAVHHREVSLTGLSEKLKGVVAISAEPVLVGGVGGRAAIMSALPESFTTTDEVHSFVQSLLKNDQIAFEEKRKTTGSRAGFAASTKKSTPKSLPHTHVIRARGGKKVLERVRFVCRCYGGDAGSR